MKTDMEWRPIETAPKDGTYLLLGNPHGSWVAYYCKAYQSGFKRTNPWFCMMLNRDHIADKSAPPTHWMPLPKAPNANN